MTGRAVGGTKCSDNLGSSGGYTYASQHLSSRPSATRANARRSSRCIPFIEVSSAVFARLREVLKGSSTQSRLSCRRCHPFSLLDRREPNRTDTTFSSNSNSKE